MLNIDIDAIREKCLLPSTFQRGRAYYRQRRVRSLRLNRKDLIIEGSVKGTRTYNVKAAFDHHGDLVETDCDCRAIKRYWGPCKHIVALLLTIMEHDARGSFDGLIEVKRPKSPREATDRLFELFGQMGQWEKKTIAMEITYEAGEDLEREDIPAGYLYLKIGESRLYVVRNIPNLLKAYRDGQALEFGKNFTYDPAVHTFSPCDKQLMDLMTEVYEVQDLIDTASFYKTNGIFSDRRMALTDAAARRFFSIMEDRSFNLMYGGITYKNIEIVKEDLPIGFDLGKVHNDLLLAMDLVEGIQPLTRNGQYILIDGRIYRPSEKQRTGLAPFYSALTQAGSRSFRFTREEGERFVSEVLPHLEGVGKVHIRPELESVMVRGELHTEIYLRPQDSGVGCDVKFVYGDREINPFDSNGEAVPEDASILIRDLKGEQQILDILNEYGFSVQPGSAHLEDEAATFEFIYSGIPRLQELAHVYYSEDFKGYVTRRKFSYSGGISLNSQIDMLEFSFSLDGIDPGELGNVLGALKEKKRYYRLRDGSFLNLEGEDLREITDLLEELDINPRDLSGDKIMLPKYRAMFLDEHLEEAGIEGFSRDEAFKDLVRNITKPQELDISPPPSLKDVLRGYQTFGFRWLKTLASYGLGGILADDMGLGKTLQVIALLLWDKEDRGQKPSLAVVPTSLVYNWEDEVKKFAPELKTLALVGTKEERMEKLKDIEGADLVITSYPLIRRDGDELGEYSFRYCILDEAQHIKNPDSQNAKMVKSIKAEARFALTGTPMENNLTELWSIFDFIMPGYLYSQTKFRRQFESPIIRDRDERAAKRLSFHIKPFILRRLKGDVLKELPEKIEHRVTAELTVDQKRVYLAYMQRIREDIEREIEEKGFNNSQIKILAGLTRLRQVCCHPSTFLENYRGGSGKMELLEDILDDALSGGHRILLFSQFTGMLAIIKELLDRKGIEYLYLDGSTPGRERRELVRDFNAGRGDVFLISLKAGGTGLNLTGADTVIHFDPWWNPAVEDQATDRAHRIGQDKVVHVMKLITRGTIEEKIFALQQKKKELIDTVIKPGQTLLSKMTEEEIRDLFAG
ncbi:MAG: SNF2 helicase associated domain-containing protein [Caldicoprobacterales bacterium]|jgi:superfamily II DNA or RNA helicase|nr:DEAD/DEAH box helicase family protein [Clostridiales bacterium]